MKNALKEHEFIRAGDEEDCDERFFRILSKEDFIQKNWDDDDEGNNSDDNIDLPPQKKNIKQDPGCSARSAQHSLIFLCI